MSSDAGTDAARAYARFQKEQAWKRAEQMLRMRRDEIHDRTGQPVPTFDAYKEQQEQARRPVQHRRIGVAALVSAALGSAFVFFSILFKKAPKQMTLRRQAELYAFGGGTVGLIGAYAFGVVDSDRFHEKIRQDYASLLDHYTQDALQPPTTETSENLSKPFSTFQKKVRESQAAAQNSLTPPF